jgi:hypothetical protein
VSQLDLLPARLREQSLSKREIVLPVGAALEALDLLEAQGVYIFGWEGWVKDEAGRHGHGTAPQGWSTDVNRHSVREAAELCRSTIPRDAEQWAKDYPGTTDQLHICITVRA